ncbi:MAG: hypothetical protein KGL69_04035, partial [Alphaproteobacteria bacterium]|nr:hypothetical protein [Alphaproteobacteria bacterium]
MAENPIGELLGGEGEEGGGEGLTPGAGLDPTAAALASDAAKTDPELTRRASDYFARQSRLVEIQTEHLHEQRAVQIALLRWRRLGEALKVGLQALI